MKRKIGTGMRGILAVLLSFAMALGMSPLAAFADSGVAAESTAWDGTAETAPGSGTGTASDPYIISDAAQLAWFRTQVNAGSTAVCAKLSADIDLASKAWTPIAYSSEWANGYAGTFDGDGHAITGLAVSTASSKPAGFFGMLYGAATVKNLVLEGSVTNSGTGHVGGIAGAAYNSDDTSTTSVITISNVVCKVAVSTTNTGSSIQVGGIVGLVRAKTQNKVSLEGCVQAGAVTGGCGLLGRIGSGSISISGSAVYCDSTVPVTALLDGSTASVAVTSTYYKADAASGNYGTAKTAAQFSSGEVAYLIGMGQTIGTDSHPTLLASDGSNKVYKLEDGSYSNTEPAGTNHAPVLKSGVSSEVTAMVQAGVAYTLDLSSIFEDADGDALTYQASVNGATVTTLSGKDYSYTSNATGVYTLVFSATDGKLTSSTYTVVLTVGKAGVSFKDGVSNPMTVQVTVGDAYSLDLRTIYSGVSDSDIWKVANSESAGGGFATKNFSSPFTYTPTKTGTYTFTFTIDGEEPSFVLNIDAQAKPAASTDYTIDVSSSCFDKVVTSGAAVSSCSKAASGLVYNVVLDSATASDAKISLAYSKLASPSPSLITDNGSLDATSWTQASDVLSNSVTLKDGKGSMTAYSYSADGIAVPLVINFSVPMIIETGDTFKSSTLSDECVSQIQLSGVTVKSYSWKTVSGVEELDVILDAATADDAQVGVALTLKYQNAIFPGELTGVTNPFTMQLSAGSAKQAFTVTPDDWTAAARNYSIDITTDGKTVNYPPAVNNTVSNPASATTKVGKVYAIDLSGIFTDPEGSSLSYSVSVDDGAVQAIEGSSFAYTPIVEGTQKLSFTASDGTSNSPAYVVNLTVRPENTAPNVKSGLSNPASSSLTLGDEYSLDLSSVFEDFDGDALGYLVSIDGSNPVGASAAYTYKPTANGMHTIAFTATDGKLISSAYTVHLSVGTAIPTDCTKKDQYDDYIGKIIVNGAGVDAYVWNDDFTNDVYTLRVTLSADTADDAVLNLSYQRGTDGCNYYYPTLSGAASTLTLQGGAGTLTFTAAPWAASSVKQRTYKLIFSKKANNAPALLKDTSETADAVAGTAYGVDLTKVFSDADGDDVTYAVSVSGAAPVAASASYSFTPKYAGAYVLAFTATDFWGAVSSTYTLTLASKSDKPTYPITVNVPVGITPAFYATDGFTSDSKDVLGSALETTAAAASDGYVPYTVNVPEDAAYVSFRGTDADGSLGGMCFAASKDMPAVTLRGFTGYITNKMSGAYLDATEAVYSVGYGNYFAACGTSGIDDGGLGYRFLLMAGDGTGYVLAAQPTSKVSGYAQASISGYSLPVATGIATQPLAFSITNAVALTVSTGAKARMFNQTNNYNVAEYPSLGEKDNGDGTSTYTFSVDQSSNNLSYRVSEAGRITKAGYVLPGTSSLSVLYDSAVDAANSARPIYGPSTIIGSRLEDSLMMNVNGRNDLVLSSGSTYRLRSYRTWQCINSDTMDIMIEPDFHYTVLSGSDVIGLADAASTASNCTGNATGNWKDLTAIKDGTAIIEVSYDAMQISSTNLGFGDFSGIYGASDPARTGLIVVQVGSGAANDVSFGIKCKSSFGSSSYTYTSDTAMPWDSEYDTLYFTGDSGVLQLSPTATTGSISKVEASNDKGGTWQELASDGGVYSAKIVSGNNLIRVTKADGTCAYQVVRGNKVSVSLSNVTTGKAASDDIAAGDTVRITLTGLHIPIAKMSGIYNPGYGYGHRLVYSIGSTEFRTDKSYQYNFITYGNYVDVQIPTDATGSVTVDNGYIAFNMMGTNTPLATSGNHRALTDAGVGVNMSAADTQHTRCLLPDITIRLGAANKAPVLTGDATATASVSVGATWDLDLSKIFSDPDGDTLSYKVAIDGAEAVDAAMAYSCTPDAVGTHTLVFTASDGSAESPAYTVVLTAIALKTSVTLASDWSATYTGGAIAYGGAAKVTDENNAKVENAEIAFVYSSSEDGDYTASAPVNAGIWWVRGSYAGDATHAASVSQPTSFQIRKAVPAVKLSDKTSEWTGSAISLDAPVVTGTAAGASPSGAVTIAYFVDQACTQPTNAENSGAAASCAAPAAVGTYYAVATVESDANYSEASSNSATLVIEAAPKPPATIERLFGEGRYDTMAAIVEAGFASGSCKTVVLATGENFPDALAASALAGLYDAPVLTVDGKLSTISNTKALAEMTRLGATDVVVCGGRAAVSSGIYSSLVVKYGASHVSRASGAGRVETALAIYEQGMSVKHGSSTGWGTTVVIATSGGFADALSVSPFAYATASPIILTAPDGSLDDGAKDAILTGGFKHAVIVGGTSVVSNATQNWLVGNFGENQVVRLAGAGRYETSAAIAEFSCGQDAYAAYPARFGYEALSYAYPGVATGQNFPDALAGAALCGKNRSVLLLADDEAKTSDAERESCLGKIASNKDSISRVEAFGGTSAVSEDLYKAVEKAIENN